MTITQELRQKFQDLIHMGHLQVNGLGQMPSPDELMVYVMAFGDIAAAAIEELEKRDAVAELTGEN